PADHPATRGWTAAARRGGPPPQTFAGRPPGPGRKTRRASKRSAASWTVDQDSFRREGAIVEEGQMFDLGPRHREIQRVARSVAERVAEFADEADAAVEVHQGVAEVLRDSGLARQVVPAAYGGESDVLDPLAIAVVREALMYSSAHLDSLFGMQGVGSYSLTVGGTEELKREWLPRVARLEAIAGLALTEPDIGSDLRGVTTTIEATATGVRVDGRKSFITNGGAADFYCVLGREGEGYSMEIGRASCRERV